MKRVIITIFLMAFPITVAANGHDDEAKQILKNNIELYKTLAEMRHILKEVLKRNIEEEKERKNAGAYIKENTTKNTYKLRRKIVEGLKQTRRYEHKLHDLKQEYAAKYEPKSKEKAATQAPKKPVKQDLEAKHITKEKSTLSRIFAYIKKRFTLSRKKKKEKKLNKLYKVKKPRNIFKERKSYIKLMVAYIREMLSQTEKPADATAVP